MSAASTSSAPRRQGLLTLRGRTVGIVGIVLTIIGLSIDQRGLARIGFLLILLPL
ncbi:MAG TPA: DUF58 domain-containing protein, partial [Cutibacterium acnes]|nr:DUF58 domain-containing protein [Cutibacterium acnes]